MAQQRLITLEEYEKLPEGTKAEVFNGQIQYLASPSQTHQMVLTELLVNFRSYIKQHSGKCTVFPAPFDVKLNDNPLIMVQPDIMIICDKNKREYWIVDPKRKIVTVNYFEKDILNIQYSFRAAIKLNIYDDLFIDFKAIEQLLL